MPGSFVRRGSLLTWQAAPARTTALRALASAPAAGGTGG